MNPSSNLTKDPSIGFLFQLFQTNEVDGPIVFSRKKNSIILGIGAFEFVCGLSVSRLTRELLEQLRHKYSEEDTNECVFCLYFNSLPCLLCILCLKDTCTLDEKRFQDPRRLYAPGRLYHIIVRKPFRYTGISSKILTTYITEVVENVAIFHQLRL